MSADRQRIADSQLRAHRSTTVTEVEFLSRGEFANDEVNELHADAFEHDVFDDDWSDLVARHSLGWSLLVRMARSLGSSTPSRTVSSMPGYRTSSFFRRVAVSGSV
jgi:hypothetical protein